jgi:P27 family predicted phage terminase small subunit
MGKRGPAPKPTALRLLHGDRKDRINTDEPPAPDGQPQCPDYASPEVREIWDYTLKQLAAMGIASPADRDALLCYCEAVSVHRRASEAVAEYNMFHESDTGVLHRNPALAVQKDAATTIRSFAGLFGLSPSSRSEIRHPKGGTTNAQGAERFLTG